MCPAVLDSSNYSQHNETSLIPPPFPSFRFFKSVSCAAGWKRKMWQLKTTSTSTGQYHLDASRSCTQKGFGWVGQYSHFEWHPTVKGMYEEISGENGFWMMRLLIHIGWYALSCFKVDKTSCTSPLQHVVITVGIDYFTLLLLGMQWISYVLFWTVYICVVMEKQGCSDWESIWRAPDFAGNTPHKISLVLVPSKVGFMINSHLSMSMRLCDFSVEESWSSLHHGVRRITLA